MGDRDKTKEQLIDELVELRRRVADSAEQEVGSEQVEKQLREANTFLRSILESSSSISIISTDLASNDILYWNVGSENIFGYKAEEVVGFRKIDMLYPDDEEETKQKMATARSAVLEGKERAVCCEVREVTKDGRKVWINLTITPMSDDDGQVIGLLGVGKDITERKMAEEELKEAQQQLLQSEKLAALGRFASGVAHEVKNPLAIILTGTELLQLELANADETVRMVVKKIEEATLRADDVLKNLLKFVRPSRPEMAKVKPDDLVDDALSFFKYRAPSRNIEIRTQLLQEDMHIEVDKSQIQQVLFNLLLNSVEAMPNGGEIGVTIYKTVLAGGHPHCVIEVADTGGGISEDDLPKLFEPFYTTKREGQGTGLGLSISKTIMANHGGDLVVRSEPGKGTDVKLVLPLA